MVRQVYYCCILFYLSTLFVLLIGCFGGYEGLYAANGKVIESFEAGPIKGSQKHVVKVKTHFEWYAEHPCPCNGEEPPCIKTFLNKDLPAGESRDIQVYNQMDDVSEKYEGGSLVPAAIERSSVRIITVPFCKQMKSKSS